MNVDSVTREWFMTNMINAGNWTGTGNLTIWEISDMFNLMDRDDDDVVTKNECRKSLQNTAKNVWRYYDDMDLVPKNTMPATIWYMTQGCYSPESYWTQLTNNYDMDPFNNATVTYNPGKWAKRVCAMWDIC